MLPTSIILAAGWLWVNHLTCEASSTEAKDCNANSMTDNSLQVELVDTRSPTTFCDTIVVAGDIRTTFKDTGIRIHEVSRIFT